ncbi:lamin tail domain-containing protein [candidate division KSB1 bacterium]
MIINSIKRTSFNLLFLFLILFSGTIAFSICANAQNVIVNEIMYNPVSLSCEYIEIYNKNNIEINLKNWRIGDKNKPDGTVISSEDVFLYPQCYFVIVKDNTIFSVFNIEVEKVIMCPGLPALNNTGDLVIIKDGNHFTIDSVYYFSAWGGEKGRSLERKSFSGESNLLSNWGTCTGFSGGTPGEENSILYDPGLKESDLTFSPDPFSPDGDGFEDVLRIKISIPFDRARVNLEIYDRYGRLIANLLNSYEIGQNFSLEWNGKNKNGKVAATGIYVLLLEILNEKEKYIKRIKKTVVLYNE